MQTSASLFTSWSSRLAFWGGSALVTAGVILHLPMFLMGRATGYRLVGMPMSPGMLLGMAFIIFGIAGAAYGLLPPSSLSTPLNFPSLLPKTPLLRRPTGFNSLCLRLRL